MKENQNLEKTKESRKMEGDDKVVTDTQKNRQNRRTEKNSTKLWKKIEMGDNQNKEKVKISHKKVEKIK